VKASSKILLSADESPQIILCLQKGLFLITYQLILKVNLVLLKDAYSTAERDEGPAERHRDIHTIHTPTNSSSSGALATWRSPKGTFSAGKDLSSV